MGALRSERRPTTTWRARCSEIVEAVCFLLTVIVQWDPVCPLFSPQHKMEADAKGTNLTALCGVAAMLYLSALARGMVAVVLWDYCR